MVSNAKLPAVARVRNISLALGIFFLVPSGCLVGALQEAGTPFVTNGTLASIVFGILCIALAAVSFGACAASSIVIAYCRDVGHGFEEGPMAGADD